MSLAKLRATLAEEIKALKPLTAAAEKDGASDDDFAALEAANNNIAKIEGRIAVLENSIAASARAAKAASPHVGDLDDGDDDPAPRIPAQVRQRLTSSEKIGAVVIGLVRAKQYGGHVLKNMEDAGFARIANDLDAARKALNVSGAGSGGFLVPSNFANTIIDILQPATTILQAGCMPIPMPNGTYEEPAGATGASASWTGEGKPMTASEPTFRTIKMSLKRVTGMVPMTGDFMRFTMPAAQGWVERNLRLEMSKAVDRGLYRGDGLQNGPLGLYEIPGISKAAVSIATGTSPTAVNVRRELRGMINAIVDANVNRMGAKWVINETTFGYLQDLKTPGGENPEFPTLQAGNPTLMGFPVLINQNLPGNLGVGNESEISLIAYPQIYLGEGDGMEMRFSDETAVVINGQTISAPQNDLGIIFANMRADITTRYLQAIAVRTGVQWGR
jgi:HK97 family phage major capsid protein